MAEANRADTGGVASKLFALASALHHLLVVLFRIKGTFDSRGLEG